MIDNKDDIAILACQIKVWQAPNKRWFDIPDFKACTCLYECESIEVTNTYMDNIGKCVLHIPRGTIVESAEVRGKVLTGNKTDQPSERDVLEATAHGDAVIPDSAAYTNGKTVVEYQPYRDDIGLITLNRGADAHIANPNDFAIGNRIQIRCGYIYGENAHRLDEIRNENNPPELKVVFTGIITGCSVDSPLEVECEDMGTLLKKKNCPKFTPGKNYHLSDFFGDKISVLDETGLAIDNESYNFAKETNVGRVDLSTSTTVNDLLDKFRKDMGIVSYLIVNPVTGIPYLKLEKVYNVSDENEAMEVSEPPKAVSIVRSDWDIASDNLDISRIDKEFLAIECHGELAEGKKFGFTLRKRVDGDDKTDEFDIVNRREPRLKKKGKKKKAPSGHVVESTKDKVDLREYVRVKYIPKKRYSTEAELINEAKAFWRRYSPNGVSGTLTVFGDTFVRVGETIGLVHKRQPEKNGYYRVESVSLKFGVDGYRRELKLPYRLAPLVVEEIK